MTEIAVVGSGALARSLCYSLAQTLPDGARVTAIARSAGRVDEMCAVASARAAASGLDGRFVPRVADLESQDAVDALVADIAPSIVVCCASYHSPWERAARPSAWTDLVDAAGFGITLPLQAIIARRFASAVSAYAPHAAFVNGCFPDAVNPLLHASGLKVLCGIGNISVLAAALQAALGVDRHRLRVLAHHLHLHAPPPGIEDVRAWVDDEMVADVDRHLVPVRSVARHELVPIAGAAAAVLVRALATGSELHTNLPAPGGLPGGYPVRVNAGAVCLDLPPSMSCECAVAWNERAAAADGVSIRPDGWVAFAPRVRDALRPHLPSIADGFHAADLDAVCDEMRDLRERLRSR